MIGAGMGISAGTSLIGSTMQAIAATQAAKAMYDEYKKELARQGVYQRQALNTWQGGLADEGAEAAKKSMSTAQAGRNEQYAKVNSVPLAPTQPAFFQGSNPARDQATQAWMGNKRAVLNSYQDWLHGLGLGNVPVQNELNRISNFSQGTASVYPYYAYNAQHSADDLAFAGQMIAALGGNAANMYQLMSQPQTQQPQQQYTIQG